MNETNTTTTLEAMREKLPYQPALLGTVAFVAATALAWAYGATNAPIAAAEAEDMRSTLTQVLPAGFADNDLLSDVVELAGPKGQVQVHLARRAGQPVGAVFSTAERGYAGDVTILMAVDAQGAVLGVRVLRHTETPGLGDKIERAKSSWIDGFAGKSLTDPAPGEWAVKKDGGMFDAFAGATVTPRAVVKAVKAGLEFFAARRGDIFGERS